MSVADELRKLGELRDSGVLTDEEFESQKKFILGAGRESVGGEKPSTPEPEPATPAPPSPELEKEFEAQQGAGYGITGMILGIVAMLGILGSVEEGYTRDSANGLLLFSVVAIVFSVMGLKRKGRGMAITGLVLGILGVLEFVSIDWTGGY